MPPAISALARQPEAVWMKEERIQRRYAPAGGYRAHRLRTSASSGGSLWPLGQPEEGSWGRAALPGGGGGAEWLAAAAASPARSAAGSAAGSAARSETHCTSDQDDEGKQQDDQ